MEHEPVSLDGCHDHGRRWHEVRGEVQNVRRRNPEFDGFETGNGSTNGNAITNGSRTSSASRKVAHDPTTVPPTTPPRSYSFHLRIMDNSLIPQGIEIVQKAIAADNENEYEKALALYRDALARFTLGLKYEKNDARKKLIIDRVEGYMKRAEELSDYLKKQSELDKGGGGGVAAKSKNDGEEEVDAEKKKLRGALAGAIITEKPNIKWDDVAGLENAKESLKEVSC